MIERIGLVNFLEGVGIDVDPNMVANPEKVLMSEQMTGMTKLSNGMKKPINVKRIQHNGESAKKR